MQCDPLRSEMADDPDFAPLVDVYVAGIPEKIAALDEMTECGDLPGIRLHAHRCRGTGASYGFPLLTEVAARCEDLIIAGAPPEEISARVGELREVLERIERSRVTDGTVEAN